MKINSICILGGGFSGFSVASVLARYRELSGIDFNIKLIHNNESIGVGESSLFSINELFFYLGIKDSQWMKHCNATYKTSIRFENFYKQGRYFYYPFGPCDSKANVSDWFILKEFHPEIFTPERTSLYFNPQSILNEENKLTDEDNYIEDNAAYHFDSPLLGKFLKKYCKKRGVEIVEDSFYGITPNDDGSVKFLVGDKDIYSADLFIDCSGFKSLLLGQMMKEEYIPFSDTLINNKALVAKIPYTNKEKQLKNYTNSVALDNGWCWEIPLWDGLSVGYVHTNMFASEEEIEKEFFDRYGKIDYTTITFKTGRYKRGWVKNVVGLGLSYGFIEPLESTGIASTLENTFRLLEVISKRDMFYTQVDRDSFNHYISERIDRYRSFIEMHYYLSSREDSEYWKYITENINYDYNDNFRTGYQQFLDQTVIDRRLDGLVYDYKKHSSFSGTLYISAGMNYSCYSRAFIMVENNKKDIDGAEKQFEDYIKDLKSNVKNKLSSYKYLKKNIYV